MESNEMTVTAVHPNGKTIDLAVGDVRFGDVEVPCKVNERGELEAVSPEGVLHTFTVTVEPVVRRAAPRAD